MRDRTPYIVIAGNIGSGKSTLTTLLSQKFQWKPVYEIVDGNPYLPDFYKDMKRWSFPLQMCFLTNRFRSQQNVNLQTDAIIQDRSLYEDAEVFAKNLYIQGLMDERDYRTYYDHFQMLLQYVRQPDLLIYLRSDVTTLFNRIEKRGRDYEQSIPEAYLTQLNQQYEKWIASYKKSPVVVVDVAKNDFLHIPKHLEQLSSIVAWELECLKNKAQQSLPLMGSGRPHAAHVN